jgi:hypothetical protein
MANLSLSDYRSKEGLDKWIEALSIPDAPVRREGVRVSLAFFASQMPTLPASAALFFLAAMDLSRPVRSVVLPKGTELAAYRVPTEPPHKLFYTKVGASRHELGRFEVLRDAAALEAHTTGTIDTWTRRLPGQAVTVAPRSNATGYMAMAGGVQYIVPNAASYLKPTQFQGL